MLYTRNLQLVLGERRGKRGKEIEFTERGLEAEDDQNGGENTSSQFRDILMQENR